MCSNNVNNMCSNRCVSGATVYWFPSSFSQAKYGGCHHFPGSLWWYISHVCVNPCSSSLTVRLFPPLRGVFRQSASDMCSPMRPCALSSHGFPSQWLLFIGLLKLPPLNKAGVNNLLGPIQGCAFLAGVCHSAWRHICTCCLRNSEWVVFNHYSLHLTLSFVSRTTFA